MLETIKAILLGQRFSSIFLTGLATGSVCGSLFCSPKAQVLCPVGLLSRSDELMHPT
jgi:hypothetical protein